MIYYISITCKLYCQAQFILAGLSLKFVPCRTFCQPAISEITLSKHEAYAKGIKANFSICEILFSLYLGPRASNCCVYPNNKGRHLWGRHKNFEDPILLSQATCKEFCSSSQILKFTYTPFIITPFNSTPLS